jgi:predicted small lipoprotein YifL
MTYRLKQLLEKSLNLLIITILLSFLHACGNKGDLIVPATTSPDISEQETITNDEQ